jgi:hypothetical protein
MKVTCPKCGSDQITSSKKGFSGKKAVAGAVLTGGIGLLAGTIGSNKIMCTCLACGNTFQAGKGKIIYEAGETPPPPSQAQLMNEKMAKSKGMKTFAMVLWVIVLVFIVGIIIASNT